MLSISAGSLGVLERARLLQYAQVRWGGAFEAMVIDGVGV